MLAKLPTHPGEKSKNTMPRDKVFSKNVDLAFVFSLYAINLK